MTQSKLPKACPCGGSQQSKKHRTPSYATCCEPHHHGTPAETAAALMRSRYSAYALSLHAYLQTTWHPRTRPVSIDKAASYEATQEWIGLNITHQENIDATHAKVRFIARYRSQGRVHRLIEASRFVREVGEDGLLRWFYLDGDVG